MRKIQNVSSPVKMVSMDRGAFTSLRSCQHQHSPSRLGHFASDDGHVVPKTTSLFGEVYATADAQNTKRINSNPNTVNVQGYFPQFLDPPIASPTGCGFDASATHDSIALTLASKLEFRLSEIYEFFFLAGMATILKALYCETYKLKINKYQLEFKSRKCTEVLSAVL